MSCRNFNIVTKFYSTTHTRKQTEQKERIIIPVLLFEKNKNADIFLNLIINGPLQLRFDVFVCVILFSISITKMFSSYLHKRHCKDGTTSTFTKVFNAFSP